MRSISSAAWARELLPAQTKREALLDSDQQNQADAASTYNRTTQPTPESTRSIADQVLDLAGDAEAAMLQATADHPEADPLGPTMKGKMFKKSAGLFGGHGAGWKCNVCVLENRKLCYDEYLDQVSDLRPEHVMALTPQTVLAREVQRQGPTPYRLKLTSAAGVQWDFCCLSENEMRKWELSITHAMRPVWRQEEMVERCGKCQAGFSWVNRKHHCRNCGDVICDDCSPQHDYRPLIHLGYTTPVRVCRGCVHQLRTAEIVAQQSQQ